MRLLLLDIGNTYTKVAIYEDKINFIESFKSVEYIDSFNKLNISFDDCICSSVKPEVNDDVKNIIKDKFNVDVKFVNYNMKFNTIYPKENELGSDLIAIMEAIKDDTFIACSFGTASVVMLVKDKKFMGCAIAPGLLTSLNGLVNSASLIKNTVLDGKYSLLGMDTKESLRTGTFNSFKYITDGFISDIKNEYEVEPSIYFFGGHSNKIYDLSKYKENIIINQNLVFEGLINIYRGNYE